MWGVCEPAYGGIEAKKRYFPNIAQEWQKSVPRMRVRKMGVLRTRISPKSGFANPISVVSAYDGMRVRKYSHVFYMETDAGLPCILYGEGLRGFPRFPCFCVEWVEAQSLETTKSGKIRAGFTGVEGRPTSTLCAGTRRQSPACAGRRHPARGRRSAAAELDVGAVLSQGDGSRGWVGGVCGERGVSTPRGTSRSRE